MFFIANSKLGSVKIPQDDGSFQTKLWNKSLSKQEGGMVYILSGILKSKLRYAKTILTMTLIYKTHTETSDTESQAMKSRLKLYL